LNVTPIRIYLKSKEEEKILHKIIQIKKNYPMKSKKIQGIASQKGI